MAVRICHACSTAAPPGGRFCSACGAALTQRADELTASYQPPVGTLTFESTPSSPPRLPPPTTGAPRFLPGQLLAGRYRIVAALGKGGMGEVYRADDLTLGQPVALKFLPRELAQDSDRHERFRGEVRIARQVAHPNVCRVYDIGETHGQPFLTMEYVDGEDLAALLKKVGRLPEDRGVEVARQICLGLAAAHGQGVIHRDLKPANVLLDGRGQVRLTDFGLAGHVEDIHGTEIRYGTPAYQAPEQFAGKQVSVQSDLYALGLVLYEIFTGKRVFDAQSREDLVRLQESGTPSRPSAHVNGLNPGIERVILRCLERDPKDRPRSVTQVLAGLPGGDPLQAALEAGETPSPAAVANAAVEGAVPAGMAAGLFGVFLLGLVAAALLADRVRLFQRVPMDSSPQALTFQAQTLLDRLGIRTPAVGQYAGFSRNDALLGYWAANDEYPAQPDQLAQGRPAAMYFWYRQSPQPLMADRLAVRAGWPGSVSSQNPPLNDDRGMVSVELDLKGRLRALHVVPEWQETSPAKPKQPDWDALFKEAGLDRAKFVETAVQKPPPYYADEWVAWEGTFPEAPAIPLRVEAASYRGQPVYFELIEPWARPQPAGAGSPIFTIFHIGFDSLILLVGGMLGYRHWRRGRSDLAGAARLAAFLFAINFLPWLLSTNHVANYYSEQRLLSFGLGFAGYNALILALSYFALEPYVRRRWPWRLVSWQRLLKGRLRDPLVGRDVLVGCAAATVVLLLVHLVDLGPPWWGNPPKPSVYLDHGVSFRHPLMPVLLGLNGSSRSGLEWFFALFLLYLLVRREWLSAGIVLALAVVLHIFGRPVSVSPVWVAFVGTTIVGFLTWIALRYGLLTLVVAMFSYFTIYSAPVTADLSTWYVWHTVTPVVVVTGLAVYGFVISLGGRPLFGKEFFGDE